jgi:hypothetical protein
VEVVIISLLKSWLGGFPAFPAQFRNFLRGRPVSRGHQVQGVTRLRYPVAVISALGDGRQSIARSARALVRPALLPALLVLFALLVRPSGAMPSPADAQNRQRRPTQRQNPSGAPGATPSAAPAPILETPLMECPSVLGNVT